VSLLPELINAFHSEKDPNVRAFLVETLWQQRDKRAIPTLGAALKDSDDRVWKEALNGLVTLASPESVDTLRNARDREFPNVPECRAFLTWLEEAIAQAEELLTRKR
jgi:hypothetical protein